MSFLQKSLFNLRTLRPRSLQQQTRSFLIKKKCPVKVEEEDSQCTGSSASNDGKEIAEGYKLIKEKQAKFQTKDDLPVWLKGGPTDRLLYISTVGLSIVGLGCSLAFISMMALK